ncbi:MAG: tetratricopeptide repeat protein [Anaeromyxobacter sp.]
MLHDARGLTLSTPHPASAEALDQATGQLLGYSAAALATIDAALERDPTFVMGHAFKAALLVTATEQPLEFMLRAAVEAGEAAAGRATDRERGHLAAARAWVERDFDGAVDRWDRLAAEFPRDALAIQLAHLGSFCLGRTARLRDAVAQALHAWDEGVPGHGYVLGMYAFGLEENGEYARAEEAGRRAVAVAPSDAWAGHAVAHVLEMQARLGEGIAWLTEASRHWAPDNAFAIHNWWHLALYHLDRGDVAAALALYDQRIRPARSEAVLELIDASALVWRLFLLGQDAGERAQRLADDWRPRLGEGYYAFNDVHALMAFVAAGRDADAAAQVAALEAQAAGTGSNARMVREVALPVGRALLAFGRGQHDACVEALHPVRHQAVRFGGSNAQRDALSLTLVEAALRAGRAALAQALASERVRARPASPPAWRLTARALALGGDGAQAARARGQAERLAA